MNDFLSRPTRNDVARRAGVSSATVSRVYNNPDTVSPEKTERVMKAAELLGYQPNRQASILRRRKSGIITLAVFRKENRPYYWGNQPLLQWMYADIIRSVLDEVSNTMFQLQIQIIQEKKDLKRLNQTDGIIGYDIDTKEEADLLTELKRPCIICHHTEDLTGRPSVRTDNFEGGKLQARWLKSRGSIRPLYITGRTSEIPADRRRMEGFINIYGSDNMFLVDDISGLEEAKERSDEIIRLIIDEKTDGLACVNDMTLLGIMTGGSGKSLPENLPMAGYDNLPVLPLFPGDTATIDLGLNKIYRTAVQRLTGELTGGSKSESGDKMQTVTVVPPRLILR